MNTRAIIIIEKEEMAMLHGGQGSDGSPNGVWKWNERIEKWDWVEYLRQGKINLYWICTPIIDVKNLPTRKKN